jgi:hypothetical protein
MFRLMRGFSRHGAGQAGTRPQVEHALANGVGQGRVSSLHGVPAHG